MIPQVQKLWQPKAQQIMKSMTTDETQEFHQECKDNCFSYYQMILMDILAWSTEKQGTRSNLKHNIEVTLLATQHCWRVYPRQP